MHLSILIQYQISRKKRFTVTAYIVMRIPHCLHTWRRHRMNFSFSLLTLLFFGLSWHLFDTFWYILHLSPNWLGLHASRSKANGNQYTNTIFNAWSRLKSIFIFRCNIYFYYCCCTKRDRYKTFCGIYSTGQMRPPYTKPIDLYRFIHTNN